MCISDDQESTQSSRPLLLLPSSREKAVKAAPLTHERRVLSRLDLHQVKDLFLYVLKILNDGVTSLSDLEL